MADSLCHIKINRQRFQLDVQLHLPQTQVLGIWGPSGCGKTSVLRALAGLDHHPESKVQIRQKILQNQHIFVPPELRSLAYVFQDQQIFPHLNVQGNLEFAYQRRVPSPHSVAFDAVVETLDIQQLLQHYPHQLSGGELQRVAIARALLRQPELMLMDEPMASLDQRSKSKLLPYLRKLNSHFKLPMIYVSHQLSEMHALCDDLLVMDAGQAVFSGKLNQAMTDASSGLAISQQVATVLEGQVVAHESAYGLMKVTTSGGINIWVKGWLPIGANHRLVIAANEVSLSLNQPQHSSVLNVIQARVVDICDSGAYDCLVKATSNHETLLSRISSKSLQQLNLTVGQMIFLQIKTQAVHSFE